MTDITKLQLLHPSASDQNYRKRRQEIAKLSRTGQNPIYSSAENQIWAFCFEKLSQLQDKYAWSQLLKNKGYLNLDPHSIPTFDTINKSLLNLSGFRFEPVAGLVSGKKFLSKLGDKIMLSTQYIRHGSNPFYTPEPDIIHEILGHAVSFANPKLAEINLIFGKIAQKASSSNLKKLGKLYWFTIEFGLIKDGNDVKAYGAGLLSSIEEMSGALEDSTKHKMFDIQQIFDTNYDFYNIQNEYFVLPSLDILKKALQENFAKYLKISK